MEFEWQKMRQAIHHHLEKYFAPTKSFKVSPSDYDQATALLRDLELDIVQWLEIQKQKMMFNESKQYKKYIKSAFLEQLEQLQDIAFFERWTDDIHATKHYVMNQLKKLATLPNVATTTINTDDVDTNKHSRLTQATRQITPPVTLSPKQKCVTKIMQLKYHPNLHVCGKESEHIFDMAVQQLLAQLNEKTDNEEQLVCHDIDLQLQPVDVHPYVIRAWEFTSRTYEAKNVTLLIDSTLDTSVYVPVELLWSNFDQANADMRSLDQQVFDVAKTLDKSFWALAIENQFQVKKNQVRKEMIENGLFAKFLSTCFSAHYITMELFMQHTLPILVEQWWKFDTNDVLSHEALMDIKKRFELVGHYYFVQAKPAFGMYRSLDEIHANNKGSDTDLTTKTSSSVFFQMVVLWLMKVMTYTHNMNENLESIVMQIDHIDVYNIIHQVTNQNKPVTTQ